MFELGKREIANKRREISLLRIAARQRAPVTFRARPEAILEACQKLAMHQLHERYLYPSEKSNSRGVKSVVLERMAYMCIMRAENGHISSDSFFFHCHSPFLPLKHFFSSPRLARC